MFVHFGSRGLRERKGNEGVKVREILQGAGPGKGTGGGRGLLLMIFFVCGLLLIRGCFFGVMRWGIIVLGVWMRFAERLSREKSECRSF